jgi:hypothetical protein
MTAADQLLLSRSLVVCQFCHMETGNGGNHATIQKCEDALRKETARLKAVLESLKERRGGQQENVSYRPRPPA